MDELESKARAFAKRKHAGQVRRYENLPYIVHLDRVAEILRTQGYDDPTTMAAAYLHDAVEDTSATIDEIHQEFGPDVAELVYWLTDAEKGRRKIRKLMSAWRLARAPWKAKLIKLADFADNTPSIVEHDPGFASVYNAEKRTILQMMAASEGTRLTSLPLFRLAAGEEQQKLQELGAR
jgi:GTP diphosphokinase / guanosine-3',5'-bis(diphosphate) 3'-diphosphatase